MKPNTAGGETGRQAEEKDNDDDTIVPASGDDHSAGDEEAHAAGNGSSDDDDVVAMEAAMGDGMEREETDINQNFLCKKRNIDQVDKQITTVFVEQPLALPGPA